MQDSNLILTVVILLLAMGLFISGKVRVDIIAIGVLALLLVLGLIPTEQALAGFANQATATIAAMFVLSAGLARTGLVQWLAHHLSRVAGKGLTRLVVVLVLAVAFLSAP